MVLRKKKRNKYFKIIIIIIPIIIFIVFQNTKKISYKIINNFFYPFISIEQDIKGNIGDNTLFLLSQRDLILKYEELQKEHFKLKMKFRQYASIKKENKELEKLMTISGVEKKNEQLRKLFKLEKRNDYYFAIAEVIVRDPVYWTKSFTINKGSNDNLKKGFLVLAIEKNNNTSKLVVIGRITQVSDETSQVVTIFNNKCQLSTFLPKSNSTGVLESNMDGSLTITYLPKHKKYFANELVYTSGFSKLTPEFMYIGSLAEKNGKPEISTHNNLYIKANLIPAANIENTRFVIIPIQRKKKKEISNDK